MGAPEICGPLETGTSAATRKKLAEVVPATIVRLEMVTEAVPMSDLDKSLSS
jgi:hypothetical protein